MDKVVAATNRFQIIIFIYLTILMSGASFLADNDFTRVIGLVLLFIYAAIKHRPLFNKTLIFIILAWCFINLLSSLYFNSAIEYYQFIGKIVLIYTAFLILSCCKNDFWEQYENFLYKLVVISFVIYLLSLIFPSIFNNLTAIFRPFTSDVFYLKEHQQHYFYSFFYVYRGGDDIYRNNGIMWEPGAYAMILCILIIYNIAKHGVSINRHTKMYLLALLTTFSTAGYLSLFILFLFFVLKGKNIQLKILFLILCIISFTWLINSDFLLPKIEFFLEAAKEGEISHQGYRDLYEANRILSFKLLIDKSLMFPFGWGCVKDTVSYLSLHDIVTVNGLGNILASWGVPMFAFFMYSIYKFFYQYNKSTQLALISLIIVLIIFFSNPIENNILLYIMILSPFISPNKKPIKLKI